MECFSVLDGKSTHQHNIVFRHTVKNVVNLNGFMVRHIKISLNHYLDHFYTFDWSHEILQRPSLIQILVLSLNLKFEKEVKKIPIGGTTGGGTGGRDLDKIEYEVNEDEECCRTATLADISELFKLAASPIHIQQCHCCLFSSLNILKL